MVERAAGSAASLLSTEHAAASSGILSSPKQSKMGPEVIASPERRKKHCAAPRELKDAKLVELQVDGKVGDTYHFVGCLVYCEDRIRNVDINNASTGVSEDNGIINSTLADDGGVIQVTLRREVAKYQFPLLEKGMDVV